MAGNTLGKEFAVTCFGESHGRSVGIIIDGCPAGLPLSEEDVQKELSRRIPRKPGLVSARIEEDKVEILSGIFNGLTTGAPLTMRVLNKDVDSSFYDLIKDKPRPGHADYPARIRYGGFNDYRGGGRFSGRLTAAFAMSGAVSRKLIATVGVEVLAHTVEIGGIAVPREPAIEEIRKNTYENPVRCADPKTAAAMEEAIMRTGEEGDSLGGVVEGIALNVPPGVGEPIFDRLDADMARALFNVPAVKGVEFGAGFRSTRMRGSENNDQYVSKEGRIISVTNHAGGVLGGLSTGMPIVARVAFKPASSIRKKQKTVDIQTLEEAEIEVRGRHDPCVIPKAVPVVEATMAMVLADHLIRSGTIPKVLGRRSSESG